MRTSMTSMPRPSPGGSRPRGSRCIRPARSSRTICMMLASPSTRRTAELTHRAKLDVAARDGADGLVEAQRIDDPVAHERVDHERLLSEAITSCVGSSRSRMRLSKSTTFSMNGNLKCRPGCGDGGARADGSPKRRTSACCVCCTVKSDAEPSTSEPIRTARATTPRNDLFIGGSLLRWLSLAARPVRCGDAASRRAAG